MENSQTEDEFSSNVDSENDNQSTFSEVNDNITLEETVFNIKIHRKSVETLFKECDTLCNKIKEKTKEEHEEPIQKTEYISKPGMQSWLEKRHMNSRVKLYDFMETFIKEHASEGRCDISERTISLNKDACRLFGIKKKHVTIHLLDLYLHLSDLFE